MREVFVANASTFLDEMHDPDFLQMDLDALTTFEKPTLLTDGSESAPFFGPVLDIIASRLPHARRATLEGADHVPQISVPDRYVELVTRFAEVV
jgi:pimeloyl-ACP methyl ester carboxylesterase